jgi:hypothetical protein
MLAATLSLSVVTAVLIAQGQVQHCQIWKFQQNL